MKWNEKPFINYVEKIDSLLEQQFGITTNDIGFDWIADCQENGWSPTECTEWIGNKHELTPIN